MKPRTSLIAALTLAALLVAVRLLYPPPPVPNRPEIALQHTPRPTVAIRGATLPKEYLVPDIVIPREEYFLLAFDGDRPESGKWSCDSQGFINGVPGVCDLLDRQPQARMTLEEDETSDWEPARPK